MNKLLFALLTMGFVTVGSKVYANDKVTELAYCFSINSTNNDVVAVFNISFAAMLEDPRLGKYAKSTMTSEQENEIAEHAGIALNKVFSACLDKPQFSNMSEYQIQAAFAIWGASASNLIMQHHKVAAKVKYLFSKVLKHVDY